jgi:ribosomal protein S18 acetylase RimI-like enzyme
MMNAEPRPPAYQLRPLTGPDEDFSFRVYAGTRAEEMRLVNWPAEQIEAFLQMQFYAQRQHYRQHYPQAVWQVIEQDGRGIGRLISDDSDPQLFLLMDIALLPEARGRGTGTAVLQDLVQAAEQTHKTISLHVEPQNPAIHLYQRLGFVVCGQSGYYLEMQRQPGAQAAP